MQKSFAQYALYFALIYVGITILFAVIAVFLSSAGSSGSVVAPFLAAMVVAQMFVKAEKRAPNNQERNKLTMFSFVIYIAINAGLLALAFAGGAFNAASSDSSVNSTLLAILVGVLAVLALLVFFMMLWAYGGLARKHAAKTLGDQNNVFD